MAKPTYPPMQAVTHPLLQEHHNRSLTQGYGTSYHYQGPPRHPASWQTSPGGWPNDPQTTTTGRYSHPDESFVQAPGFGPGAVAHPTFNQYARPNVTLHSTAPAPTTPSGSTYHSHAAHNHPIPQQEAHQRPSQGGARMNTQEPDLEHDRSRTPRSSAPQNTLGLPATSFTEHQSFKSVEEGVDEIEALFVEEFMRMRAAFERSLGEMQSQLVREQREKENLKKRVCELEAELHEVRSLQQMRRVGPN